MIIITGQTATGKTKLALELAKKYNGELISADSRQIYKYLDIVTGKDTNPNSKVKSQKSKVKFKSQNYQIGYYLLDNIRLWGLDLIEPDQAFSSSQFVSYVNYLLSNLIPKGKPVIIVGGTYLYIKHLLYGIETEGIKPDWQLRNSLNQLSVNQLQSVLQKKGPKIFKQMNRSDQNNPHRLIRKIEILNSTSIPGLMLRLRKSRDWKIEKFIGLQYSSKDLLHQNILTRVQKRINQGAVDETKKLLKMGYKITDPGLNSIGYQQIINYINGNISERKMIDLWVTAEVQYAKRQYTFMKKDKNIEWKEI